MRIDIAKEAFNRGISLLTSKINIEFKEMLYMVQRPGQKENCSGSIWRALECGAGGEWRR